MASNWVQVTCVVGRGNGKHSTGSDPKMSMSSQNALIAMVNSLSFHWFSHDSHRNERQHMTLVMPERNWFWVCKVHMASWTHTSPCGCCQMSACYSLVFWFFFFLMWQIKCLRGCRAWKAGVPCMLRNRPSQQQGLITQAWFQAVTGQDVSWSHPTQYVITVFVVFHCCYNFVGVYFL
jgi:hypothetical protein